MRLHCPDTARRLYRDANAPIMTALAFAAYRKKLGTIDDIIKELKSTKMSCPCCQSDLLVKVHDGKLSVSNCEDSEKDFLPVFNECNQRSVSVGSQMIQSLETANDDKEAKDDIPINPRITNVGNIYDFCSQTNVPSDNEENFGDVSDSEVSYSPSTTSSHERNLVIVSQTT